MRGLTGIAVFCARDEHLHLASVYRKTLGKWGEAIFMLAFVSLMYAIISAYLAGGTDILLVFAKKIGVPLSHVASTALFITVLGAIVCSGTNFVDQINRYVMALKGIFFLGLLWFFSPSIQVENLSDFSGSMQYFPIAIPIIFLIFGYQLVLPTLYLYLERNNQAMRQTIYLGSLISIIILFCGF